MNKKQSAKQYAIALYELSRQAKGKNLDAALKKFVEILARDRKLKKAGNIIREYEKYEARRAGIVSLTVYSARELSENMLKKISTIFGGKTDIKSEVDPKLLGGIKIRTEDKILDASLSKQLQFLKQAINK